MTPKLYENEQIPNNEDKELIMKLLTPLLNETMISNFFRKMTYIWIWSESPIRSILSTIHIKEVFDLTEFVFQKFREVSLSDVKLNDETPPNKKRKLGDLDLFESDDQDSSLEIHPNTLSLSLPVETLAHVQSENPLRDLDTRRTSQKKLKCQATYKSRMRGFVKDARNSRRKASHKKSCTFHIADNLFDSVMLPLNSAHSLSHFFHGCINFIPVSRLVRVTDIDMAMKAIVQFGKVSCIQDHWIERGPTQYKWMGALVTYRHPSDCRRVFKESFSYTFSGLVPMDIKKHLVLIAQMEIRLTVSSSKEMQIGTCVVISKIPQRASREKLRNDLELYGELVSFEWSTDKGTRWSCCEVTYRFTVEAFAAALALDGKRFYRSTLKTRLKMSEKVKRLHLMVSGSYS